MKAQHTSAHACTTLPNGDVPMRDEWPDSLYGSMHLVSACRAVKRYMRPQYAAKYPFVPIGTWSGLEERKASNGIWWSRSTDPDYWVVDNFGDMVRVAVLESGAV